MVEEPGHLRNVSFSGLCLLCATFPSTVTMLPCQHSQICFTCIQRDEIHATCPWCRSHIEDVSYPAEVENHEQNNTDNHTGSRREEGTTTTSLTGRIQAQQPQQPQQPRCSAAIVEDRIICKPYAQLLEERVIKEKAALDTTLQVVIVGYSDSGVTSIYDRFLQHYAIPSQLQDFHATNSRIPLLLQQQHDLNYTDHKSVLTKIITSMSHLRVSHAKRHPERLNATSEVGAAAATTTTGGHLSPVVGGMVVGGAGPAPQIQVPPSRTRFSPNLLIGATPVLLSLVTLPRRTPNVSTASMLLETLYAKKPSLILMCADHHKHASFADLMHWDSLVRNKLSDSPRMWLLNMRYDQFMMDPTNAVGVRVEDIAKAYETIGTEFQKRPKTYFILRPQPKSNKAKENDKSLKKLSKLVLKYAVPNDS